MDDKCVMHGCDVCEACAFDKGVASALDPTVHALAVLGAWFVRFSCAYTGRDIETSRTALDAARKEMVRVIEYDSHGNHDDDVMDYATPQIAATVAALTQTGGRE